MFTATIARVDTPNKALNGSQTTPLYPPSPLRSSRSHQIPIRFGGKRTLAPLAVAKQYQPSAGTGEDRPVTPARGHNLDGLLVYLDESFVGDWLMRANLAITDLQEWWCLGSNAMSFSQFWLAELADDKRGQLLELEYELLREEIRLPFMAGMEDGRVTEADLSSMMRAVLREYPAQFSGDGTAFLDIVWGLSREKTVEFKEVLSKVNCSTKNTQYAQWLLAARSFTLISMVTSITNFYRKLATLPTGDPARPATADTVVGRGSSGAGGAAAAVRPSTAARGMFAGARPGTSRAGERPRTSRLGRLGTATARGADQPGTAANKTHARPGTALAAEITEADRQAIDEAFFAAKEGHAAVLYYLLSRDRVQFDDVDADGRSLLLVAVAAEQEKVAAFLLENVDQLSINARANSGNTALHTAASNGSADLVEMLLAAGADPSAKNPTSGVSPRELAELFADAAVLEAFVRWNTDASSTKADILTL